MAIPAENKRLIFPGVVTIYLLHEAKIVHECDATMNAMKNNARIKIFLFNSRD